MYISREKFAYLIDSTAAPIAGLAPISTWISFEVGLLNDVIVKRTLKMCVLRLNVQGVKITFKKFEHSIQNRHGNSFT